MQRPPLGVQVPILFARDQGGAGLHARGPAALPRYPAPARPGLTLGILFTEARLTLEPHQNFFILCWFPPEQSLATVISKWTPLDRLRSPFCWSAVGQGWNLCGKPRTRCYMFVCLPAAKQITVSGMSTLCYTLMAYHNSLFIQFILFIINTLMA